MAQAAKRRKVHGTPRRTGSNVTVILLIVVGILAAAYYVIPAITAGDLLWFSSDFNAQPRQITIIDRGQRTTIGPADPRFAPIVDAFNQSLTQGYRAASLGFSEGTWEVVDRNGLLVEAIYAEPVRLHARGGFAPTERLLLLINGEQIHTTKLLFRSNPDALDPIPMIVNNVDPIKTTLEQHGFGA